MPDVTSQPGRRPSSKADDADARPSELSAPDIALAQPDVGGSDVVAASSSTLVRDPLTGLYDRHSFFRALEVADTAANNLEAGAAAASKFVGIAMLNIARLKRINAIWGTEAGDRCLIEVAQWLAASCAESDLLARVSSNEFMVAYTAQSDILVTIAAAGERFVRVEAQRIGISFYGGWAGQGDGHRLSDVRVQAEIATAAARKHMWPVLLEWTPTMSSQARERLSAEETVRTAIAQGQLAVGFQPVVDVEKRSVESVEALARLKSPRKELPAQRIVELSSGLGLAAQFATSIFDTAFAEGVLLRPAFPGVKIAVNLARELLGSRRAIELVAEAATRAGVALSDVIIELTEDIAEGISAAVLQEAVAQGIELGMQVVIDDFGTGETSLSLLRLLPVAAIKLDRSLLPADGDNAGWAFLEKVATMLEALTPDLIAEGVETPEQSRRLRQIGINLQQGYLFGRPQKYQHWLDNPAIF